MKGNTVACAGLGITLLFFAYCAYITRNGPVAQLDMTVFGWIVLYTTIVAVFATMFVAGRRAWRAGRAAWLFAIVFLWPTCFLYALVIDRGEA